MTSVEFVRQLRHRILVEIMAYYKDSFENTSRDSVIDDYWQSALAFFDKLDEDDRKIFFKILHQVQVDGIAQALAILDGVAWLEGQGEEEFVLTTKRGESLSGELSDIFLGLEEEEEGNVD